MWGCFRDSHGRFIFAYFHHLEACSATEAELWGIYRELRIAYGRGYHQLSIETNSSLAFDFLTSSSRDRANNKLIRSILEVDDGELSINWKKIRRETNLVADILARRSRTVNGNFVIFDSTPDFLVQAISVDIGGSSRLDSG